MPTKTKTSSSASNTKEVKKPVAKKKTVSKKTAVKKTTTKKAGAKKKPVAKKSVAKKTPVAKTPELVFQVEEETVPVVTIIEKSAPGSRSKLEVHHKIVFLGTCRNCDHMPMGVNKLIGVLSISIAILSGLLLSTALPGNFEMPSLSVSGFTDWISGYTL
ncbi:hypothetical protein HQ487_00270 [Candidatus Uhrbacteria bacterium]|nr:hypothetical protein [Candidatus Uhrbacteria bacterium]